MYDKKNININDSDPLICLSILLIVVGIWAFAAKVLA